MLVIQHYQQRLPPWAMIKPLLWIIRNVPAHAWTSYLVLECI